MSDPIQPCWNTAVRTPKAAPMDSRFITAAVSGMTIERKTIASSRNESKTTSPMKRGSFSPSTWAKSAKIAVNPPTSTVVPVPAINEGRVEVRSRSSSWVVSRACGELVG